MGNVLLLSHKDIKELNLDIKEIIDEIKHALKKHALNETILKPKISIVPRDGTFYTAMPGGIKEEYLGLKLIERFPNENYPGIFGTMFLSDYETGKLLSVLDATWLTSMRTGAIAAITIELLTKKEVEEVSIMGLGNTAIASLLCIKKLFPNLKKVKLLKYKNKHIEFSNRFRNENFEFEYIDTLEVFIKTSDVIISCITYADKPFANPEWLKKGVLILPVHSRGWQSCDKVVDKIYTDDYYHTKHFIEKCEGELGEVLIGKVRGREAEERIIAYNIGMAIDDIALAKLIYEKALKENKGKYIEISNYDNEKCVF